MGDKKPPKKSSGNADAHKAKKAGGGAAKPALEPIEKKKGK